MNLCHCHHTAGKLQRPQGQRSHRFSCVRHCPSVHTLEYCFIWPAGRSSLHMHSPLTSAGPQAPVPPAAAEQESAHTVQESDGTGGHGPSIGGAAGGQAAVEAGSEVHTEALLEQIPQMPDGIGLQPGSVAPGSQLTQLSRNPEPSQAGTGAQPEQDPAGRVPAEQAAASVGGGKSPGQSMPDAELSAPAAAPVAEAADTAGPAGRPEGAAATGNTGTPKPLLTDNDAAAEHAAPLPGPKVAAADSGPGCRASGRADGPARDALLGLSAAVPHAAPLAPGMEQGGAPTAGYARTPANTQQGRHGGQAAAPGQAQAEADPKALAGPCPMQGPFRSMGKPAANQLAAPGQTVLGKPSSASSMHFSQPQQPQMQQAGHPLPSGQAAAVLAGHGLSRGPAAAGDRNSPVAVSLPTHRPSAFGAPGSLGGNLRPLQPSMSQAANGPLLGGGPQQPRIPMSSAAGGHCLSACSTKLPA